MLIRLLERIVNPDRLEISHTRLQLHLRIMDTGLKIGKCTRQMFGTFFQS